MDHTINPLVRQSFEKVLGKSPASYLLVDIARQRLTVIDHEKTLREYPVSTSKFGVGNAEGSFKTPLGVHRIAEKIGLGAPAGRIFRDRIDTGEDWPVGMPGENLILSRILRLEGLEPGVNKGPESILSNDTFTFMAPAASMPWAVPFRKGASA